MSVQSIDDLYDKIAIFKEKNQVTFNPDIFNSDINSDHKNHNYNHETKMAILKKMKDEVNGNQALKDCRNVKATITLQSDIVKNGALLHAYYHFGQNKNHDYLFRDNKLYVKADNSIYTIDDTGNFSHSRGPDDGKPINWQKLNIQDLFPVGGSIGKKIELKVASDMRQFLY